MWFSQLIVFWEKAEWKYIIDIFSLKIEISDNSQRHFHFYLIRYFKKLSQ